MYIYIYTYKHILLIDFAIRLTRTRTIMLLEANNILQGHKEKKLFIL